MTPDRIRQIEDLYAQASALARELRDDFLARACAGDEPLRREVEILLALEGEAEYFMETPAFRQQMDSLASDWDMATSDLTGRRVGRYRIQEMIGAGGMGVVYRALDTRLGRDVALKVLPPGLTADQERRMRFIREAKAASALNHPGIITIYDIDKADGIEFIAMEYIAGRTLQDLITSKELTAPDAVNLALQIVQALAAAHSAGIVHRDIKPANIMIVGFPSSSFQAKVLDFGLAKLAEPIGPDETLPEDMTQSSVIGTAAYMSPEQAEGRAVDARSDIFAFGCVLYETLSGSRAFQGSSNLAILSAILKETPPPVPGIPANLQKVISSCLQKDPGVRFQKAGDVKVALEACLPLSAASSSPVRTIAVLPFINLSGDRENEYFSDGLTEEMIGALTGVPGLKVTARTSAFALRGKNLDAREIGARLNVEHILEGSVRSSGSRVRVTAQMVSVADGYQLWSARYDREMKDVLEIQDEISRAIVDTLRVHLSKDISRIRRHTESEDAYSLYLRGRHSLEKHTPEGYAKARQCFEQALAADPKYSMAFLGLAEFYWQIAFYGFHSPKEALAGAKEAATRAIEIDGALPEGHALLGTMLAIADYDWRSAAQSFRRALDLDPASPYVLFRYANFYLWPQGRAEEAVASLERALSVDPLWVLANWVFAYYVYAQRQYDRAVNHLQAVIEMEPMFYLGYSVLGLAYAQMGLQKDAILALERACELSPDNPFTTGMLAYGLGKSGRSAEAQSLIEKLHELEKRSYVPAKSFMFAFAGLGDAQNVLVWAEKSLEDRDPMTIMNFSREPILDIIRSNPRYLELLRKVNLQPSHSYLSP
jgi:serine/threonine-protein kinase